MQEAIAEEMEGKKQGKNRSQKQLELAAASSKQLPVGATESSANGIAVTPAQNGSAAQMSRISHTMQPTESANLGELCCLAVEDAHEEPSQRARCEHGYILTLAACTFSCLLGAVSNILRS